MRNGLLTLAIRALRQTAGIHTIDRAGGTRNSDVVETSVGKRVHG